MNIRTFERGDDAAQVAIYNEAAADLPKFKPATLDEVRRRTRGGDFDPQTRFVAVEGGRPIGYVAFRRNGRVSYPWCRKGSEAAARPLFAHALAAMKQTGLGTAFAAYRGDWTEQNQFLEAQGFRKARDMVNFVMELVDMPTPALKAGTSVTPLCAEDIPAVFRLAPGALRVRTPAALDQHLMHNDFFTPESVFVIRSRHNDAPAAVGVLIANADYADPTKLDSDMPCFRLGAFGTEEMSTKRVKGLFSFLAAADKASPLALDLMSEAASRLGETDLDYLAAQVPSDAPHLLRFYQQYFRRQGSFPMYEKEL